MGMPAKVTFDAVSKSFNTGWRKKKVHALKNVSFSIPQNSICGLLGPNGSGKSTLIKILLQLIKQDSGTCKIFTNKEHSDFRESTGYLPEAPYFHKHLSPIELLQAYKNLYQKKISSESIESALCKVGLEDAKDRAIRNFSKGMLQRFALAQALIHDPDLLILDEPTAGMDAIGVSEFAQIIKALHHQGKTILLCSHLLSQMEELCTHAVILYEGKVIADQPMSELLKNSNSPQQMLVHGQTDKLQELQAHIDKLGLHYEESTPQKNLEKVFMNLISSI